MGERMINNNTTYIDEDGIQKHNSTIVEMITLADVLAVRLSNGEIYILNSDIEAKWIKLPRVPNT